MKTTTLLGSAAFALGLLAAVPARPTHQPSAENARDSREDHLCGGGQQSPLGLELVPTRIDGTGSKERLELTVELTNRFETPARAALAWELVDDRGRAIVKPSPVVIQALRMKDDQRSHDIRTPELDDGYYQLRITAAAIDGEGEEVTQTTTLFLESRGGSINELDVDEFRRRSDLMLAYRSEETK